MLNERNTLLEDDGIEEEILVEEECSVAQAVWGDIQGNIENQTDLQNALDAKQDSLTEAQLSAVNSGITNEKVTTYDGYADQIASKADQSALNAESVARGEADMALGTRIDNEALARQQTDNGLQSQIDAITSKSDVVDVVANYAALQAYDTSTLGNNDVVKVLDDETHEDALTYYRWSTTTQTWSYIGQEAPYYSKGQMDVKLAEKQDKLTAGANIQIQNGTISATDTKYTNGNGLNLNGTEFSADTDVLATKEDLEGYYTKPETDNLLAPKLEAEVVTELPTTGAEGKLYLTPKAHTAQTATGNPITATVTEGAGAIESFQLDGNTFQQSYTGANLIDIATTTGRTRLGITATPNADGSITFSGTASSTGNAELITYTVISQNLPAGDYTFSISKALPEQIYIHLTNLDGTTQNIIIQAGSTEASGTFTQALRGYDIRFHVQSGTTYSETIKMQLQSGTTASNIEPFVGGVPSPNPDYPQPIQTVTGEQTVEIVGKNLLDYSAGSSTSNGITFTVNEDKSITANGTATAKTTKYLQSVSIEGAGTYSESSGVGGASGVRFGVKVGDIYYNTNTSRTITLAEGESITSAYLQIDAGVTVENLVFKPMVELGSTSTTYAPYSKQTYEINLGKNLFDKENANVRNAYLYNNELVIAANYGDRSFILPCEPNTTYTISRSVLTSSFRVAYSDTALADIPMQAATVQRITCAGEIDNNNGTYITITTGGSAKSLICHYGHATTDVSLIERSLATIQVELGSKATSYASYFEPIELCKLGTYQDYIYKSDDKWYLRKETDKYVYNNNLGENGIGSTYVAMLTPALPTLPNMAFTDGLFWCNSYTPTMQNNTGLQGTNASGRIRVNTSLNIASSYAEVRALAAANNLTIHYPLATPTDTTITDTELIAQLEAIRTASLENGTNTITNTATGTNLAGDMEIGYYGYNPTNRYDKFIWLDLNNNYEQIGS